MQYFQTRTFGEVVEDGSNAKPRRKIFGAFLYEDTNTYFFSRTNLGKSILAFQIGYAAASGTSLDSCLALRNDTEPMKVLVADLEMDSMTLNERHGLAKQRTDPALLANLVYLHENPGVKPVFSFDLLAKIEKAAVENNAKLIILDNISRILPDLLKAEDVSRVIEFMKRIRQNTGASFLVIGHCVKSDPRTAISPQSYFGSAHLMNFFTEMFFLDASKDERFYLCHSKTKRAEIYSKTVPVFTRGYHSTVGLGFSFQQLQDLHDIQLPLIISPQRSTKRTDLALFRKEIAILDNSGVKRSRIAEIFNVNPSTITRVFDP